MKIDECRKYELYQEDGINILKSKTDETVICTKAKLLEVCGHCEEEPDEDCSKVTKFYRKLIK